jgi:hypothetical protein
MFPGLPNISSAGNPISLPSIIILGVYPVLLFTEDLNAPADYDVKVRELKLGDLVYQLDTAIVN